MGYTHSWYRPVALPRDSWTAFIGDWRLLWRALERRGLALDGWADSRDRNPQGIHVNGIGDEAYEDFQFSRVYFAPWRADPDGLCFNFCKTARMPYDLAVTACLVAAKRHFGALITVCSDGTAEDWIEAKRLCQETLGYDADVAVPEPSEVVSV